MTPRPEQPATTAGKKLAAFITGLAGGGYSHAEAAVADVEREAAAAALPDVAELAAALGLLAEALDGWALADALVDSDRRLFTDPPCEDEIRIGQLRAFLAAHPVAK